MSVITEDFLCDHEKVRVSINKNSLSIKSKKQTQVIDFTFDIKFQMLYEKNIPVGFTIFVISESCQSTLEERNHKVKEKKFRKNNWVKAAEWEQALMTKITCNGFSHKFKVMKLIGKGNFSDVFQVEELKTKKLFAAKKILMQKINDSNKRASLEGQIKILRMLDNPNISKMFGVYKQNNILFIVLEYIDGVTLQSYLSLQKKKGRDIAKSRISKIIRQILIAVKQMSQRGILHRDIKPENILITSKKQIKIIDFNLATLVEEPKYIYVRCGTPGYVAPEILQIKSENFNTCRLKTISDVFSVGIVFFKLVFGKNLFEGQMSEILKKNYICKFKISDNMKMKMKPSEFELMFRMLDANPQTRITPTEALNHPYFQNFHFLDEVSINIKEKQNILDNSTQPSSHSIKNQSNDSKQLLCRQESFSMKGRKISFTQIISELGKNIFSSE